MLVWALAIIGIILMVVGFITHLWIVFLLAAISFIISFIFRYSYIKSSKLVSMIDSEELIIIESRAIPVTEIGAYTGSVKKPEKPIELRSPSYSEQKEPEQEKPIPSKDTKESDKKIKSLAELRDRGILTQEEFEEKKAKILQNSTSAD